MVTSLFPICFAVISASASADSGEISADREGMMKGVLIALALFGVVSSAAAQEQRGSIEGIVRDSSGGVLPAATIEARSPSMAGVQTTVTDTNGLYRFPALPPGRYEVSATLQGFQPAKSSDVRLELGQILKIDL